MFDEWIHVLPPRDFRTDRRARALVRRPSSELTSKLDPTESSSSSCPSLITFSRSVPPWLSLGQDYYVSSHHVHSATIKDIQSAGDLTVWINVLDPLDGRQIIAHDKSSDIDVVYLEDQNPLHLVPRVSYQLSDVIVMIGENLEDAADQHLLWLQSCKAVSGNPAIKPYAFIVVRDIQDERTLQEDFIQACLMSRKAQDFDRRGLEELSGSLFEHCRCLSSEDNLEKEIITAVRIGRRLREARKCLWSQKTFFELRTYLTWALASKPLEPLNIVKALSMVNPVGEASGTLWPELASILEVPGRDNDELLEKFFIPVMGSCFARNVLKCDHGNLCIMLYSTTSNSTSLSCRRSL